LTEHPLSFSPNLSA